MDTTQATIGWSFEGEPLQFDAEYGVQGFELGSGTPVGVTESFLHLDNLQPDTYYDVYVRCVCDDSLAGEWAMVSFHTDTLVPPVDDDTVGIHTVTCSALRIYPNPAHGQCVVQFGQEVPKSLRLYTIDGVLLQEIIPQRESVSLQLPSKGVYMLHCEMKEGTVVRKIVNG